MNECILMGRAGKDAETKYLPNGTPVIEFSLATTESWGKGEEKQEKTYWHQIKAFGKTAEIWGPQIKKGDEVFVKGSVQPREYDDKKTGNKQKVVDIQAAWIRITGRKSDRPASPSEGPRPIPVRGPDAYPGGPSSPRSFSNNSSTFSEEDVPF